MKRSEPQSFFAAMEIGRGDVVCIVGAGGKTSLMFRLAAEAKQRGLKVLVTTTTRLLIPDPVEYDAIDLTGKLFTETTVTTPGIYVGGQISPEQGKMTGGNIGLLDDQQTIFDLILIEADGAARKPLKGWKRSEPVIPLFTTKTIGVIDIQTIGQVISRELVHRLEIFLEIAEAETGELVSITHLLRIIIHKNGLFQYSQGQRLLYINKVESQRDSNNVNKLQRNLNSWKIIAGSVQRKSVAA